MKKNLILLCAAALVFAACTKTTAPETALQPFTLSAGFNAPDARTYAGTSYGNSVATVYWTSDDALSVFDSDGANNQFTMDAAGKGKASADFNGSITLGSTAKYAMFPYDAAASISGDVITTTLKTTQSSNNATSFSKSANLAIGAIEGSTVQLKNACGLIRFVLPTMDAKSVTLSCKDGYLAGKVKLDCSTGTPEVSEIVEGSKSVTLSHGTRLYASSFFLCVLPGTYKGITVTVTKEDDSKVVMGSSESTIPLVVARAQVTDLGILSAVADKIITLDFTTNDVFTTAIPTSNPAVNGTVDYTDAEGNGYVLGITDAAKGGGYFYSSTAGGLCILKKGKAYLQAPTILNKHLCAFGATHGNSSGAGSRDLLLYTPAGASIGSTFTVPGYDVTPSIMYYTTGVGLSSSKKYPDVTCRFSSGNTNNVVIRKLVLYYAND